MVETYIEYPNDVRLLRDAVLQWLKTAARAWNACDLGSHHVPGWRQRTHLRNSLPDAYNEINTSRKGKKNPDAVLDFFRFLTFGSRNVSPYACDSTRQGLCRR